MATAQPEAFQQDVPTVLPGSVPNPPSEGGAGLRQCIFTIRQLSSTLVDITARVGALGVVARECWQFLRDNGSRFASFKAVEEGLTIPRMSASRIHFWFGRVKGFPDVERLAAAVEDGVPIQVSGGSDIQVALQCGNHRSVVPFHGHIVSKIYNDVRLGRAFIFPRDAAHSIPGLPLAPLGVVVPSTKVRILHDLTFDYMRSLASVNGDTDFESASPVRLRHVLRNFIWRILHLRRKWPRARILLSKMDVADAFRQVSGSGVGA